MARQLAVILPVLVACAACGAKAAEQAVNSPTMSASMASYACGMGCGDHGPTLITTNQVTGTIGQPVPAIWWTGSGTVTLTSASWAGPELVAPSDSVRGGGSANGTYLVLSVSYECATGIVPISWLTWTAQPQGDDARWTPIDSYPPEAREAPPPEFHLDLAAGQRRDTTIVFDMPLALSVEVVLADADNMMRRDVNLLATWTVTTDQSAAPTVATSTG